MVPIGIEIARTELIFHPAVLERVDYMATTYECPDCKNSPEPQFTKEESVAPLVSHSYIASGLAAHVMYGKFINALPYYRQEKDFENQFGVKIGRGTMAHWTDLLCTELLLAYDRLLPPAFSKKEICCRRQNPSSSVKGNTGIPSQSPMCGCSVQESMD